jgi:hypothetical protein
MPEYNLPLRQPQAASQMTPVSTMVPPATPATTAFKIPLKTPEVQTPPRKYEINYDNDGNIFYNGNNIGNLLYTNLIDLGEDVWLENWAKQTKVDLTPSTAWINASQQQDFGMGGKQATQITPVDKVDPTEDSLVASMGVSGQQRASDKPQESFLNGLSDMNPLTTEVQLPGINELNKWQDNPEGYGKGFAPGNINPFFTK